MILDRDLTPDLLDVSLSVANADTPWTDKRMLFRVALRDHISAQEADGKTKKCLTRVWINLPGAGRLTGRTRERPRPDVIAWARDHPQLASDRRLLHLGAVLAMFPFAGSVAVVVGRALALDGQVEPVDARRRVRDRWGDRSSVDVGARKTYTTFVRLGALPGDVACPSPGARCSRPTGRSPGGLSTP